MSSSSLSRQELYERVWSEPLLKVSKDLGISDVGLAKVCKRYDIPTPPRGSWAKKRSGKNPRATKLPNPQEDQVVSFPLAGRTAAPETPVDDVDNEPRITVANQLRSPHRLVVEARECLSLATKDACGRLQAQEPMPLSIVVSKSLVRRALLISDALLKSLEDQGHQVQQGPKVTILGQSVGFQIEEPIKTVQEVPTEHDLSGDYQFGHSRRVRKRVATGRLKLVIPAAADRCCGRQCRASWSDGKNRKLEDCLNEIIHGLVAVAERLRDEEAARQKRREAERERAEQAAEAARERARRRRLQAEEQQRVDDLLEQLSEWKRSQELRAFVEVVLKQHEAAGKPADEGSDISNWASWARRHADRMDPLRPSPTSILDERIPDEPKRGW